MTPEEGQALINKHFVFPLIEQLHFGLITYPDVVAPSGTWRAQCDVWFQITHYERIDVDPWTLQPLAKVA